MSALSAVADAVAASLKERLGGPAAPAAKRRASADASGSSAVPPVASGGKRPGKGQSSNPFSQAQNVWLRGASEDSFGAFGKHVSARLAWWSISVSAGDELEASMQREGVVERAQEAASLQELISVEREKREEVDDEALQACLNRRELNEQKQSAAAASTAAFEAAGPNYKSASVVVVGSLGGTRPQTS